VDGEVIVALFFTIFGTLLLVSGVSALRRPIDETTSVGEAIAFHMTGDEPLPKPRWFKDFERAFHFLLVAFGGILFAVGISSFFSE
jgi:hypothetical protein